MAASPLRRRDLVVIALAIVTAGIAAFVVSRRSKQLPRTQPSARPEPSLRTAAASSARPSDAGVAARPVSIDANVDSPPRPEPTTLAEQRAALFEALRNELHVSDQKLAKVRAIFDASTILGQGNPKVTEHPMTRERCRELRAGLRASESSNCGEVNMALIESAADAAQPAKVCIDQYEFPNIACEYPVVNVSAREAALLCEALGKRLCDAHEWEGACAGALRSPDEDYTWEYSRETRALYHNRDRERVWAYGTTKDHSRCATGSRKSRRCTEGGFRDCGSNTYPAGAFPECVSRFGVYDQHGNAAEHMNLALEKSELASQGGHGWTEMKGSWFFFSRHEAHEDDCRWRAPAWHGTKVMDIMSHSNYHLGFRCCKSVEAGDAAN